MFDGIVRSVLSDAYAVVWSRTQSSGHDVILRWSEWVALMVCRRTTTNTHTHSHSPHRKPKALKWEWERKEGGRWITSFPPKGKSVWTTKVTKPQDSCSGIFFPGYWIGVDGFWRKWDTFSSAYLFQDGFSLWRLVSKTAQKELGQLDCEVGEEGKISYNIRGNALWNNRTHIKEVAMGMDIPESYS